MKGLYLSRLKQLGQLYSTLSLAIRLLFMQGLTVNG